MSRSWYFKCSSCVNHWIPFFNAWENTQVSASFAHNTCSIWNKRWQLISAFMQGQKFWENLIIHSRKDSCQQICICEIPSRFSQNSFEGNGFSQDVANFYLWWPPYHRKQCNCEVLFYNDNRFQINQMIMIKIFDIFVIHCS